MQIQQSKISAVDFDEVTAAEWSTYLRNEENCKGHDFVVWGAENYAASCGITFKKSCAPNLLLLDTKSGPELYLIDYADMSDTKSNNPAPAISADDIKNEIMIHDQVSNADIKAIKINASSDDLQKLMTLAQTGEFPK